MSNASEILGYISSVFGILTIFGTVGGLLPRSQMRETKAQLDDIKGMLDRGLEAYKFGTDEMQRWKEKLAKSGRRLSSMAMILTLHHGTRLEDDYHALDFTFSQSPLTIVMPIFGPWKSYRKIWSLLREVRKSQKELTSCLLKIKESSSQDIPIREIPAQIPNPNDSHEGDDVTSKFSRRTFTRNSFAIISPIIELARKVRNSLHRKIGSSKKCQAFLVELDSFAQLLHSVYDVLVCRQNSTDPVPDSVVKAIQCTLESSKATLGEFYASIEGHQTDFWEGRPESMMWESWRKVQWALFKQEKMTTTRDKLRDELQTLNALMSALQWTALDRLEVFCKTQQISLAQISRYMEQLPSQLGYSWRGGANGASRPILLTDMLGQSLSLPIELCASSEKLDGLLKLYFKDRVGRGFVDRGEYELTIVGNDSTPTPINPMEWRRAVHPGSNVGMNAVIRRKVQTTGSCYCPSCKRTMDEVAPQRKGGQNCPSCGIWLTISQSEGNSTIDGEATRPLHAQSSIRPSFSSEPPEASTHFDKEDDDMRFIRRIHIIEERQSTRLFNRMQDDRQRRPGGYLEPRRNERQDTPSMQIHCEKGAQFRATDATNLLINSTQGSLIHQTAGLFGFEHMPLICALGNFRNSKPNDSVYTVDVNTISTDVSTEQYLKNQMRNVPNSCRILCIDYQGH
ncbi:uncharacterized protein STEHIDRAFT_115473 [Stereum hirsutum FP-91666 SS1]|uniref:uncharacterized protein n=1 Tax=Stereum hirsutum (strain FP-91666) TaxID=721885 RepID=UPI0004449684|nr:uncharacterized protein STEHIDRAFT_115473 [Stereum hirsutum FP-91666 SS1]EIM80581.1 hypothetical protein STEHIDRAFT_115473 [Stereum hirsutum FP-91666 SS1]